MPAEPVPAEPTHRLTQLTTYELRDYLRQLESAIAFFDRQDPVPPARHRLQAKLDDVIAEQDDRSRLAHAHDVRGMTSAELQRARRDLQVSLALAFPGSPMRGPILAHRSAIDAELGQRRTASAESR